MYQSVLWVFGLTITSDQEVEAQNELVVSLREENQHLYDELFRPRDDRILEPYEGELPYDQDADSRQDVGQARKRAIEEQKYLMVTFGANWCNDCRNLHRILNSEDVQNYTRDRFSFVNVD